MHCSNHALNLLATGVTAFARKNPALEKERRGESRAATPPQVSADVIGFLDRENFYG